jgi:sugar phosphate isomerase/epimerase
MKLGFLTAAFPDLTLDEVAGWAASQGFETLEIACWPAAGGERRRYAGVTHIDVDSLDPDGVRELLAAHGLEISALAYYPNNLHPDAAHREEVNTHLSRSSTRRSGWRSAWSVRSRATTRRSRRPTTWRRFARSGRRSSRTRRNVA